MNVNEIRDLLTYQITYMKPEEFHNHVAYIYAYVCELDPAFEESCEEALLNYEENNHEDEELYH